MQDRYFSDEDLVAFLDGEADFAPVEAISAALATDQTLVRRLEALRVNKDAIAASFASLTPGDRAGPVLPDRLAPERQFRARDLLLAAGLALVVGLGSGIMVSGLERPGWREYVAAYQALYSNVTLAHIEQTDAAKQAELTRVAAAVGKTVAVDTLQTMPEVEYKRAQILSFKGQALIQLAFLTSTGEPVALCVLRASGKETAAPRLRMMEGMSAAAWSGGGYEYLLIGGTDSALVSRMASEFAVTL